MIFVKNFFESLLILIHDNSKGQLISKAKYQAVDSPKKRTNELAFFDFKSCYVVKSNAVCSFFWRICGLTFCLRK